MVTSRTRTSSFSNSTRCDSGAATTASIDGGQVQLFSAPIASPPYFFAMRHGSAGGGNGSRWPAPVWLTDADTAAIVPVICLADRARPGQAGGVAAELTRPTGGTSGGRALLVLVTGGTEHLDRQLRCPVR